MIKTFLSDILYQPFLLLSYIFEWYFLCRLIHVFTFHFFSLKNPDNRFRVTLRHSGDGSKLFQGLQGSLHVQHWRLCLIGEPSTGCKFICNWRLDHVDKAYTMTMPAQSANQFLSNNSNINSTNTSSSTTTITTTTSNSTTGITNNSTSYVSTSLTTSASSISSSSFNTGNPLNLDHHRNGSRTGLTTISTVPATTTTMITSPSTTALNNPNKYLFFMECSPASGKGNPSSVFLSTENETFP